MAREETKRSGRGNAGTVIGVLVVAFGLALVPAQGQIPQVEFGSCGPMDVVFIIDTTGSMQDAINNIKEEVSAPGGIVETVLNAAGEDFVPDPEARLGLVITNGFMPSMEVDGQNYDCFIPDHPDTTTPTTLGGVGDCIIVVQDLGSNIVAVENSILNLPDEGNGGPPPEITAEALRTVLDGVDQTSDVTGGPGPEALAPLTILGDPDNWPRLQWNDWNGAFRSNAKRVVFLITDNVPGGTDSLFNDGGTTVDSDLAAKTAADYAATFTGEGIVIQPILVEIQALCVGGSENGMRVHDPNPDHGNEISSAQCTSGGGVVQPAYFDAQAEAIMQAYADATGGQLTKVPSSGEGTALSIIKIIENCGGSPTEGRMTGGGSVFHENSRSNPRVTHGFTLHCDGGPNRLQVNWRRHRFHLELLQDARCFDNPQLDEQNPVAGFDTIEGEGVGRLNGVPGATIEFKFIDDGEPGKVSDTAFITISDGGGVVLEVSGRLNRGNHQAHREN